MPDITLILGLLAVVITLVVIADRLAVPYPLLLVVGGLALALIPGLPAVELQPDLVFVLFVPMLLYRDAQTTSWRDFYANRHPIFWQAVGLVVFTTCGTALVAHLIITRLAWPESFLLGAIVSSTDAVAASSIFARLGVPMQVAVIIEGESLVNDASALVVYTTAVAAVVSKSFSLPLAAGQFVLVAGGGIVIGLLVGWLFIGLRTWLGDIDPVVESAIALLTPFAAYLPAQQIGASGVLAVVTAGLYVGRKSPENISSSTRLRAGSIWDLITFLLNGLAFILIGLQLHGVLSAMGSQPLGAMLVHALLVSLAVIVVRILWVFPANVLARLRSHWRAEAPTLPWRQVGVIAWSGMRGVVALATALALPAHAGNVQFPQRDLLIFLSFVVILVTLLLQGLSLPLVIKALGVGHDDTELREEHVARTAAAHAALARLDQLDESGEWNEGLISGLRASYTRRLEHLDAHARGDLAAGHRQPGYELRRELLDTERHTLIDLRNRSVINDTVLRRIQHELDLEEVRIEAALEDSSTG